MSGQLVVGGDGLLGRAITAQLGSQGREIIAPTRRREEVSAGRPWLDLAEDISAWRPPAPARVAYLCAAAGTVEACRRDPSASALVNVEHTVALARTLTAAGTFVVFLSSNLVFAGEQPFIAADSPYSPRTEYGRQKVAAEQQLLALGEQVAIVRLTKVLGPVSPPVAAWINALRRGQPIHPFADMMLTPLPVGFAAAALCRIGERRLTGITQLSGPEEVTYEQVARHLANRLGAAPELVQPMPASASGLTLEHLPRHSSLDSARLRQELQLVPPPVWTAIDSVFS